MVSSGDKRARSALVMTTGEGEVKDVSLCHATGERCCYQFFSEHDSHYGMTGLTWREYSDDLVQCRPSRSLNSNFTDRNGALRSRSCSCFHCKYIMSI